MKTDLKNEVDQCIWELERICVEINDVATEVKEACDGLQINQYKSDLENVSYRYRKAANKLRIIR